MTTLRPPLTIISDGGSAGSDRKFHPPAATWFDEDPLHFVALESRSPRGPAAGAGSSAFSGSGDASRDVAEEELPSEIVRYQAFGLPKDRRHGKQGSWRRRFGGDADDGGGGDDDPERSLSAFDAAKKAAQESLQTLPTEISVAFPLPYPLATMEVSSPSVTDDDDTWATDPTVVSVRRIPILAKFSPKMDGMRFLALQYTRTMVRIATVEGRDAAQGRARKNSLGSLENFGRLGSGGGSGHDGLGEGHGHSPCDVHWTIELSCHADPVASRPEETADLDSTLHRGMFGKPKEDEGIIPGTTSVIGGGVLWSAREGRAGDASLDLLVVATTAVIVYHVALAKGRPTLVKSKVLPHDPAASFWYEARTRTLLVGSYRPNDAGPGGSPRGGPGGRASLFDDLESERGDLDALTRGAAAFPTDVLAMKTLFFSDSSPSVGTLPSFVVGTLREVEPSEDERHELLLASESFGGGGGGGGAGRPTAAGPGRGGGGGDAEGAVVLPTEIFLVNLYGDVYCVELGSLGSGRGIGLTKLDREGGCIHVRHHNFEALKGQIPDVDSSISVGVIDNLLVVFSKKVEMTYFLDVADVFSDDQRLFRECVQRLEPATHDENFAFLAPQYFLDTSGQGLLYQVVLSLPLLLQCVPASACVVPFVLRRDAPRDEVRSHVMGRFATCVEAGDMDALRSWAGVIVDQYAGSETAGKFDRESTVKLLPHCALTSWDDVEGADVATIVGHTILVPANCSDVVTQTEMLQMILLPHAMSAIRNEDPRRLRFVSTLSVHYLVELERRCISPSVALQCLVVALLWRTGEDAQLASFLSARQTQWTITRRRRVMNLPTANKMYFDIPGAIPYAETIFAIAKETVADKASVPCSPSTRRQLISHATVILLGCGATFLTVKCLLSVGQLKEAINICTRKIKPDKVMTEGTKIAEGTRAKDFFRVAVSNAKNQSTVAERCRSFYLLHCFLQQWDPSVFRIDSRKMRVSRRGSSIERVRKTSFRVADDLDTVVVEQSAFAHECPRFPDELFGGRGSSCCRKLRGMFGYASSVSASAGTNQSGKYHSRSAFAKSCPVNIDDSSDDPSDDSLDGSY